MRAGPALIALPLLLLLSFPSFAAQPLTRADCTAAGMSWDERGNVCADSSAPAQAAASTSAPQPLTRAGCDEAGHTWNESTNVCGTGGGASAPMAVAATNSVQPLTRAGCGEAGMTWNDTLNVCGVTTPKLPAGFSAPAVVPTIMAATAPKSEPMATQGSKPKKAKAARSAKKQHHVAKKHYKRKVQAQAPQTTERRPFRLFPNLRRPAEKQ